ncbi:MAG: type III-B CRISPR module-associated protein Cmr5 [Flavobacteriales bacterium]
MQTRTQKFALRAYPLVEKQSNNQQGNDVESKKLASKYRTLALTFPNMILQSGLSQATGFLLAKGKDEHMAYLNDLARVMADGLADGASLHQHTINSQVGEYQQLTRRALDASAWLKRYTQALLKAE